MSRLSQKQLWAIVIGCFIFSIPWALFWLFILVVTVGFSIDNPRLQVPQLTGWLLLSGVFLPSIVAALIVASISKRKSDIIKALLLTFSLQIVAGLLWILYGLRRYYSG